MKVRIILASLLLIFFASSTTIAQKKSKRITHKETTKPKAFHVKQHVMVTMKDGSQVEAVVHGHLNGKNYWVRQWHSGHEGRVKEKYMRALSEGEVSALKKTKKK